MLLDRLTPLYQAHLLLTTLFILLSKQSSPFSGSSQPGLPWRIHRGREQSFGRFLEGLLGKGWLLSWYGERDASMQMAVRGFGESEGGAGI